LKAGDEVLIPEMTCHTLLEPFNALKIDAVFYGSMPDLSPDWRDAESKITPKTQAIVMIHYFGIPQQIKSFMAFCRRYDLYLIEDNAHGFGGRLNGQMLGSFGDIGVSSPWKTFPVFNGAYLYLKKDVLPHMPVKELEPKMLIFQHLKTAVRLVIEKSDLIRKRVIKPPPYASQDAFREPPKPEWRMDAKTHHFLEKMDLESIKTVRQDLYRLWQEWTAKACLRPVFNSIPPHCMPMAFPAYASSHAESKKWYAWGYRHGIDIFSWPTLPISVVAHKGLAYQYWKKLVCFPIHQDIDPIKSSNRLSALDFDQ